MGTEDSMESKQRPEFTSKKTYQLLSSIAAGTGGFTLGLVVAWSSPCLGQIRTDPFFNGVTEEELSWIASLFPIGAIFSGSLAGFLQKHLGGKKSMLFLCIPSVLAWLLMLFARNVPMLYAGRFLLGLCNGAQPLLIPIYVSQIAEDSIRGFATAPFPVLCTIGILFVYVFGSFLSWTALTALCAIFPAAFCIILFFIPETPGYLISKGDKKKAGEVLMWLRGADTFEDINEDLDMIQEKQEALESTRVNLKDYFAPEVLKPVLMVLTIILCQQFSGINCIFFFAARIFGAAKTGLDSDLSAIIMVIVNLVFGIVFMFLVDKLGRKVLLLQSCVGCAASLYALGAFFYMQESKMDTSHVSWLPLASLALFNIAYCSGLGPVPFILMAEVLPSKFIESASGLTLTFHWVLAFALTRSFSSLVTLVNESGSFWTFASACIAGAIFTILVVPETKQRSLEDIQRHFNRNRSNSDGFQPNSTNARHN